MDHVVHPTAGLLYAKGTPLALSHEVGFRNEADQFFWQDDMSEMRNKFH